MTAVKGPFVFTSDAWSPNHIERSLVGGCRALAVQLGVAPAGAGDATRRAGLQVIGWGTASNATRDQIAQLRPDVWMPQAEGTGEFEAMVTALRAGVGQGLPCEPVMTAGGMELNKAGATSAEVWAERQRRHAVLTSLGVKKVWAEVYRQDADRSGTPHLGDVNHMVWFFEEHLLFGAGNVHPVLGLWTADDDGAGWARNPYSVSSYDLSKHGRTFGAWRAEQMADARYPEIREVPPLTSPAPPPTDPTKAQIAQNRFQAIAELKESVDLWREQGVTEPVIAVQRQTLAWRVLQAAQTGGNMRAIDQALDAIGAPTP